MFIIFSDHFIRIHTHEHTFHIHLKNCIFFIKQNVIVMSSGPKLTSKSKANVVEVEVVNLEIFHGQNSKFSISDGLGFCSRKQV